MKNIRVLKPGTEVDLIGGIKGVVVAAMIDGLGCNVSYRVMWPNGQTFEDKWVADMLVEKSPESGQEVRLGFTCNGHRG